MTDDSHKYFDIQQFLSFTTSGAKLVRPCALIWVIFGHNNDSCSIVIII